MVWTDKSRNAGKAIAKIRISSLQPATRKNGKSVRTLDAKTIRTALGFRPAVLSQPDKPRPRRLSVIPSNNEPQRAGRGKRIDRRAADAGIGERVERYLVERCR